MRLSFLRVACALGARIITPAASHSVRAAHARLVPPPCLTLAAHVAPTAHAQCMHLDAALCRRKKKEKRGRQWGPKRGCRKKCKKRGGCVKNPKVCLQDLHKHSRKKHNPNCCPCKKPPTMDPYRRQ